MAKGLSRGDFVSADSAGVSGIAGFKSQKSVAGKCYLVK
jgi:hypothetical protein